MLKNSVLKPIGFDYLRRAQNCIAQGALTNSKRPECMVKGVYPSHARKGRDCFIEDNSGNEYIDFICGLGTNILGYGHKLVNEAIKEAIDDGVSLSLSSTLEVETAETVKQVFPFIEKLKFAKTGSDACSMAVRIARAKTKREWVLSEGYHGTHDLFVAMTPPAHGVDRNSHAITSLEKDLSNITRDVAAVIVEPIQLDDSLERIKWLKALSDRCRLLGVMLIFDEIITGGRYPGQSVAYYHGFEPDLICLGKAMANGMPIAMVGGKVAVMECEEYFYSSTYAGDRASLAACKKTLELLTTKYQVDSLWEMGGRFAKGFNHAGRELVWLEGYNTRWALRAKDDLTKAVFMQECLKSFMLFGPSVFISHAHETYLDNALDTINDICAKMAIRLPKLDGEMPSSPFAKKVREQ